MNKSIVAVLVLGAAPALAGVTMKWEQAGKDGSPTEVILQCEGKRVRMETSSPAGSGMIWDGDTQEMISLQGKDKTYRRVDVKALNAQMGAMREQMKAQMDKMPPEQRAQMEKMMGPGAAAPAPKEPPKFTATGKKAKVGSWDCEWYDVVQGGSTWQACVVPWDKAKVKKEDLACLTSMKEAFAGLAGPPSGESSMAGLDGRGWPGVVVSSTRDGEKTVVLKSVKGGTVPEAAFKPDGYAEKAKP